MSWLELATALFDTARATTGLAANWLIQSTLLISGGLILGYLLRHRGSAVQSAIYRTTLVAVLACPMATWGLTLAGISGWSLQMPEAYEHENLAADVPVDAPLVIESPIVQTAVPSIEFQPTFDSLQSAEESRATFESASTQVAQSEELIRDAPPIAPNVEAAVQRTAIETLAPADRPAFRVQGFGFVAAAAGVFWLVAGGFLLCRLARAWWKLDRLRRSAWTAEPTTLDVCRELSVLFDVSPPEVLHSPYLPSPCLAGLRRPAVLLPEAEMSLPVRDVLVHELAHLRRHDCWWNLLRRVATAVLFFQPLLWKLSRRLDSTAEEVCDDYVVQLGGDRRQYAHRLVDIAELSLAPAAAAGVGIVSLRSMLATRVARIMDTSRSLSTRAGSLLLGIVLFVGLAATLLVGMVGIKANDAAAETQQSSAAEEIAADGPDHATFGEPADEDADDLITVNGQVVDPNGRPVPRADVYALRWFWNFGERKPLAQVKTDDGGRFEISYSKSQFFEAGRPEQWREAYITAFAEGFGPSWVTYGELKPGQEATLRLVPDDVPIEGRIVDLEGHPVVGATVEMGSLNASKKEDLSDWLEAVRAGQSISTAFKHLGESVPASSAGRWQGITTDSGGRFRMTGIGRERQIRVHIKHPSIVTQTLSVVTREMEPLSQPAYDSPRAHDEVNYGARFEYAAAPSRPIEGVVRDAQTREPIADVEVWSSKFAGENISGVTTIKTKTDDQGRYRLEGMPKGEGNEIYVVPVDLPYFTAKFAVPDPPGIEATNLDIELHRGQWIQGRVTDQETGRGVSARMYYIVTPDNALAPTLPETADAAHIIYVQERYRTNQDGTYRVVGLPGRGIVAVGVIQGSYPGGQGYEAIADRENHDGYMKFNSALSPGEKFPTAIKEVHVVEGKDDTVCDFALDSGRKVTLRVIDPAGMPLAGVEVQGIREVHDRLETIEDATFEIIAMRDKEARTVLLRHEGRGLGKALRVKASDGDAGPITVQLEPVAKVRGRLVDGDGEPVRGVHLRIDVSGDGGYGKNLRGTATDSEGRFQHNAFLPGLAYTINAEGAKIEFATVTRNLEVQAGETIDLGTIDVTSDERPEPKRIAAASGETPANDDGAVTIRGQVVDENGKPISGATVRLPDDSVTGGEPVSTNQDGRFEIEFDKAKFSKPEWHQEPWRWARLVATADGFAPVWIEGEELTRTADHTLKLKRDDVPVRGQILTLEGQPVPHAKLEIWDIYEPHSGNLDELFKTLRDSPDMFQPHMNRQMSYFPGRLLDLKVERGTLTRGTLTNAGDGNPIITTDENGQFEFRGIGPERMVRIALKGANIQSTQINVATRGEIDPKWQRDEASEESRSMMDSGAAPPHVHAATFKHFAGPSAPIRGVVKDKETGEPIAGIHVGGWLRNTDNHAHAVTDENGRYELIGLGVEGTFQQLYAGPAEKDRERLPYLGAEKEKISFSVTLPLSEADTAFELTRGVVVRGRVTDAVTHKPVKARVEYMSYENNPHVQELADPLWPYAHAMTDENGEFSVAVLPGPGTLAVWTRLTSSVPDKYRPVDAKDFGVPVDERGMVSTANDGLISPANYKAARFIDFKPGATPPFIEFTVNPLTDMARVRCVDPQGRPLQGVSVVGHLPWRDNSSPIPNAGLEKERGDRIYIEIAELDAESRKPVVFRERERKLSTILFGSRSDRRPRLNDLKQADDGVHLLPLMPSASITGRLVDKEGQPVRSGEVELYFVTGDQPQRNNIELGDVPVEQNGRFEIRDLPAGGPYLLAGGSTSVGGGILKRDIELVAGQTLDLGALDVTKAEQPESKTAVTSEKVDAAAAVTDKPGIQGRVVGPDGNPVKGAELYWLSWRLREQPRRKPQLLATTDAEGMFRFTLPAAPPVHNQAVELLETQMIVVTAKGFGLTTVRPHELGRGPAPKSVLGQLVKSLAEGVSPPPAIVMPVDDVPLRGRIVDIDGEPVVGAKVALREINDPKWQGRVTLPGEDAEGPDAVWRRRLMELLQHFAPPQLSQTIPPTTTDADGRFTLHGLGRDRLVELLIEGERIESTLALARTENGKPIRVEPDQNYLLLPATIHGAEFTQVVGPSKSLTGRVLDLNTGEPIPGAVVKTFKIHSHPLHTTREREYLSTTTDAEGRYRITGLPIGNDNKLVVLAPKDQPYVPVGHTVDTSADGSEIQQDFRMKRGVWAQGRVYDAQTNEALTGKFDYYVFRDPKLESEIPGLREAHVDEHYFTDADGNFRIPVLRARGVLAFWYSGPKDAMAYPRGAGADKLKGAEDEGEGTLKMYPTLPHYLIADNYWMVVEVNPSASDEVVKVDVPLSSGRTATVRVTDASGRPLNNVDVHGKNWGWDQRQGPEIQVIGLQPGRPRKVLAYHPNMKLAGAATISDKTTEPLPIKLIASGAIRGRLIDEDGEPIGEAKILPDYEAFNSDPNAAVWPYQPGLVMNPTNIPVNKDGTFEIVGLVPGWKYSASAVAPQESNGRMMERGIGYVFEDVTVESGQTIDLGDIQPVPYEMR